jgi:cytochrome c oxidase subunit 3
VDVSLLPPPVAPATEKEAVPSDNNSNGSGGGNFKDPDYRPDENSGTDPERWATPLSAYRTAALFLIFSIASVFATLTHILAFRWIHSRDWVSLALPHILYFNTAVLLTSSMTMELARLSALRKTAESFTAWLSVTLFLGIVFVAGQFAAWREFSRRGLYVASNPGSFFFYFLTAAHAVHLAGGVLVLSYLALFASRLARKGRQQTAAGAVALYWHFMDLLWLYLLALLFFTLQR